jgi:tRNA nucleotidyltransferase (CCA-adding enzyme)
MMRNRLFTYLNDLGDQIGAEFYLVGGAVRDEQNGMRAKDFDFVARGLPFEALIEAMRPFGKTETTGQLFNVIRHFPNDRTLMPIEVALPRRDVSTGVNHNDFEARYDHNMPIEEDLMRRDFTINSMAISTKTGELYDPTGGAEDLKNGLLNMLHEDSAKDDALRIIRGLRFMARLGLTVTEDTDRQLRENVALLHTIPGDRIRDELVGLITQPHIDVALRYGQAIGAWDVILPELAAADGCTQNQYHSFDVFEHTVQVVKHTPSTDPYVKLAALFHDLGKVPTKWIGDDGIAHFYDPMPGQKFNMPPQIAGNHEYVGSKMALEIMKRLRFSNHHADRVAILVREHMFNQGPSLGRRAARRFLARLANGAGGVEANVEALFAIREGDTLGGKTDEHTQPTLDMNRKFHKTVLEELEADTAFKVTDLALNGHDLMALGLRGKAIGIMQKKLLDVVIDEPDLNTKTSLENLIKQELQTA